MVALRLGHLALGVHEATHLVHVPPLELVEDIGIDAKQSFEDSILPITSFMDTYGDRIAGLGGVDMDKLCRLDEPALRAYCRSILDHCMPKGRYAYGTGNTVANYVPIDNYLIMMDEGYRYR